MTKVQLDKHTCQELRLAVAQAVNDCYLDKEALMKTFSLTEDWVKKFGHLLGNPVEVAVILPSGRRSSGLRWKKSEVMAMFESGEISRITFKKKG